MDPYHPYHNFIKFAFFSSLSPLWDQQQCACISKIWEVSTPAWPIAAGSGILVVELQF